MRTRFFLLFFPLLALLSGAVYADAPRYQDRWFYVSRNLSNAAQVEDLVKLVNTAADHGLNGILLAGGFDTLDQNPPQYFTGLEKVKEVCRQRKVEIIPILFSAGYGGGILAHDRNLAEGLPVTDAPFLVHNGEARLEPDPDLQLANGGFEEWQGNRLKGFAMQDQPGEITVPDHTVFKDGQCSLRLQRVGELSPKYGHARVMQEIKVRPHRRYRVQLWVRTENLRPTSALRVQAYAGENVLAPASVNISSTSDWRPVTITFNSGTNEKIRLYAGLWEGKAGTAWLDGLSVTEVGLADVLRRPGTPLQVRSVDGQTTYVEGKDFAPVADPELLRGHADPAGPPLRLLPGSRLREGDRLLVSFYHGQPINDGQVTICMSEPKVYDIWREQARLVQRYLAPKKWFLSMDEIRAGGSCRACKDRGLSMAQILGDCITRQMKLIRAANPKAEIYCWSDMLDPAHNAHGNYYLVDGDYTGSWQYVPKDLIIACWYYEKRDASLPFFSGHGFRTLAAAYYDADNLDNCKGWLDSLSRTPNARGIMYTSWSNKYALLAPFGDLLKH